MVNKMEKCLHPVLAKRDQNWFCSRIQAEMKQQGLGYLILQTPYNVMYATGYSPLVGSSAAIIPAEGDAHLIISTLESADAYASTNNVDVREFMSWVFIDNGTEESRRDKGDVMDPDAVVHMTIDLIKNTPMDGKVGIEMGSVSHAFYGKARRLAAGGHDRGRLLRYKKLPRRQVPVGDRYASSGCYRGG